MSFLSRRAEAFFDRFDQRITDTVKGMTNAAPKFGLSAELKHQHDRWLRSARLNVEYFGPNAVQEWVWPQNDDQPHLVCLDSWVFNRREKYGNFLIDESHGTHVTSWDAWQRVGALTDRAPAIPEKPRSFMPNNIRGNLLDESTWGLRRRVL